MVDHTVESPLGPTVRPLTLRSNPAGEPTIGDGLIRTHDEIEEEGDDTRRKKVWNHLGRRAPSSWINW
jgi:hypothetical protein